MDPIGQIGISTVFFQNESYRKAVKENRYDKLDFIVFVSEDARKEFHSIFGAYTNTDVIYNLIDGEMVRSRSQAYAPDKPEGFLCFAMGSLLPVKGFDRLIRAARILKEQGRKFKVQIAGKGPEKDNLLQLISDNDLIKEVELIGFKHNPYPILRNCEVFVLTSESEALPTVICEAMILGKPIVATECAGSRELLGKSEYGLLTEQDDQDLAAKLAYLMDTPSALVHLGEKAMSRSALFNDAEVLKHYYKIFDLK